MAKTSTVKTKTPARQFQAAIFYMDLKGSSKIHDTALPRFIPVQNEIIRKTLDEVNPPLEHMNTWGDSLVLISDDAPRLAEFAVRLRNEVHQRNWAKDDIHVPVTLRVALHAGPLFSHHDVVLNAKNVFGSSIVLAARIEPIVHPGFIYCTEEFRCACGTLLSKNYVCDDLGIVDLAKESGRHHLHRLRLTQEPASDGLPVPVIDERFAPGEYSALTSRWMSILRQPRRQPESMFIAAGSLSTMGPLLDSLGAAELKNIKNIYIAHLTDAALDRRKTVGMLEAGFEDVLTGNMKLVSHKYGSKLHVSKVDSLNFHGVLFGDYCHRGQWVQRDDKWSAFSEISFFSRPSSTERFSAAHEEMLKLFPELGG